MRLLDATLLAPLTSPLFRRFVKKSDPSSLKLNAEIVFDDFKHRIRGTIRDLCAKANSADPFLDQRYFWCAYDLVRKRRANHIQSWRKHGMPSNFTYGGKAAYEAIYGKLKEAPKQKRRPRASRKKKLFPAPTPAPAPTSTSPPPPQLRRLSIDKVFSDSDDETYEDEESDKVMQEEESQEPSDFDPFENVDLMEEFVQCANCQRLFDWNNSFRGDQEPPKFCDRCQSEEFVCTCESCGKKLTARQGYPKGNSSWASGEHGKSWCATCYSKVLHEQIIPQYNEFIAEQERRIEHIRQKRKRGDDTIEGEPEKKTQKTPCKKCGALTHKTARSRLCPFNKKYQQLSVTPPPTRKVSPAPRKFGGKAPRHLPPMAIITEPVFAGDEPPPQPVADVDSDAEANPSPQSVVAGADPPPSPVLVDVDDESTPPPPCPVVYAVGTNVLARFNRNQYALTHVIKREGTSYDVYFPEDGMVKRRLPLTRLRSCPDSYAAPKVTDMLGKTFVYEGDDEIDEGTVWRVRQIVDGDNGVPEYRCTLTEGTGRLNVTNFDVGYVMRTIKKQLEKDRETGPKID